MKIYLTYKAEWNTMLSTFVDALLLKVFHEFVLVNCCILIIDQTVARSETVRQASMLIKIEMLDIEQNIQISSK